jgi:hypothetical protein
MQLARGARACTRVAPQRGARAEFTRTHARAPHHAAAQHARRDDEGAPPPPRTAEVERSERRVRFERLRERHNAGAPERITCGRARGGSQDHRHHHHHHHHHSPPTTTAATTTTTTTTATTTNNNT